jgi:hypothetical protein
MNHASPVKGISYGKRVSKLLGEGKSLMNSLQGLIRVAKIPQD